MKNLILILTLSIISLSSYAQTFKLAETENTIEKKETVYQLKVAEKTFTAYLTKVGQNYILRTSANGNEYKQYLGYDYGSDFNGRPIYTNKEQSEFWVLGLSKSGYPKKIKLEKE
jgi:hypothetical protein